jgi:hypothetical protein
MLISLPLEKIGGLHLLSVPTRSLQKLRVSPISYVNAQAMALEERMLTVLGVKSVKH